MCLLKYQQNGGFATAYVASKDNSLYIALYLEILHWSFNFDGICRVNRCGRQFLFYHYETRQRITRTAP